MSTVVNVYLQVKRWEYLRLQVHENRTSYSIWAMSLKLGADVLDRSAAALPLTTQLADHLRQAITSLDLQPGEILPGENKIADQVELSRPMVRDALDVLASEGLIVRRKGAATRVAIPPSMRLVNMLRRGENPTATLVSDHGARDEDYALKGVEITQEKATGQDAEYLRVRKSTPILRRRYVEWLGPDRLAINRQAIRYSLAKGTALETEVSREGIEAELAGIGAEPNYYVETWNARPPNRIERDLLQTPGPVYDILRLLGIVGPDVTAGGLTVDNFTPVQVSRVITPCARNRLHVEGRLVPG